MNIISEFLVPLAGNWQRLIMCASIADLMILALPIPIVWRLTLELRQKIILSVVFTLGSMYVFTFPISQPRHGSSRLTCSLNSSCVISLVRLLSIVTWIRVGDSDITWTLQPIVAWSYVLPLLLPPIPLN